MSHGISVGEQTRQLTDEAIAALGRLRGLWPYLADARMPGSPGAAALVQRRHSERDEHREDEHVRRDRRAAFEAIRAGRVPSGPHPAPARLAPINARRAIALDVVTLTRRALETRNQRISSLTDLSEVRRTAECPWCKGAGRVARPAAWTWEWPEEPLTCALCGGFGESCTICKGVGPCACEPADVLMAVCMAVMARVLSDGVNAELATNALHTFETAGERARRVLGLGDDHRHLKAPCPACDRRELYVEVSSPNPREWSTVCQSQLCVCAGPGCGCQRPVRWPGRRHRWPSREFGDLADLLGVELPLPVAADAA